MISTPQQYDAMAGDVYGDNSYTSQHHGDISPPTYTVHFPVVPAHTVTVAAVPARTVQVAAVPAHTVTVPIQPARDVVHTGDQAKAAFRVKHGFVYEGSS